MSDPSTWGTPPNDSTADDPGDVDDTPPELPALTLDGLRGIVAGVKLVFMFQNRRRRGELVHAAEQLGLIAEGEAEQYLSDLASGNPNATGTRAPVHEKMSEIHSILADVPPLAD